jgi:hypothetical protein
MQHIRPLWPDIKSKKVEKETRKKHVMLFLNSGSVRIETACYCEATWSVIIKILDWLQHQTNTVSCPYARYRTWNAEPLTIKLKS